MDEFRGRAYFKVYTDKGVLGIRLEKLALSYDLDYFGNLDIATVELNKNADSDIEMYLQEKIDADDYDFWDDEFDVKDVKILKWEVRGDIDVD